MSNSFRLLSFLLAFNLFFTLTSGSEENESPTLKSEGELIKSLLYIFLFLSVLGVIAKSDKFAHFFHKNKDIEPQTANIHGISLV